MIYESHWRREGYDAQIKALNLFTRGDFHKHLYEISRGGLQAFENIAIKNLVHNIV